MTKRRNFDVDDKVKVFGFTGTIVDVVDTTKEPHLYAVKFDAHGDTYVTEAEHIEDMRDAQIRIKSFADAVRELGEDNLYVRQWQLYEEQMNGNIEEMTDLTAYFKLRIITEALNEGWKPTFDEDETRFYPWLWLYTEEEYNNLDEDDKLRCCRVVGRSNSYAGAGGGLVCAYAYDASSGSYAYLGSRLAFKTRELALYAGKQFIELWCDFLF